MIKMFRKISKWWAIINPFEPDVPGFEQTEKFCTICDGRIWPWQHGTRLYSLGMTRAHISCAASYLKSELEAQNRRVICGGWNGT